MSEKKADGVCEEERRVPSPEPPQPKSKEKEDTEENPRVVIHDPGNESNGENDRVRIGRI